MKIKENELDREAFDFVTKAPDTIIMKMDENTSPFSNPVLTSRMFISNFERKVLSHYINTKKYKRYISLANNLTHFPILPVDFDVKGRSKIFNKIEKEASFLHDKVDQQIGLIGMQTLWGHAESILWDKKIFICEPEHRSVIYK